MIPVDPITAIIVGTIGLSIKAWLKERAEQEAAADRINEAVRADAAIREARARRV